MGWLPLRSVRARIVALAVLLLAGAASVPFVTRHRPEAMRPDNAAGDSACVSCHEQLATFATTAHRLTSRLPARQSILGSFRRGENVLATANPSLRFRMDSTAAGYYQTAVIGSGPDTSSRAERIAIVTGLRKGQSYLYWTAEHALYQLPISYWTGVGWAYSPRYPEGQLAFGRAILPRCLECHASWFESVSDSSLGNRYRPESMMLGISCETCHGAGRQHARRQRSPVRALLPRAIVNPARLSRARQLDACALCHGGTAPLGSAPFSFVPGQRLEKVFRLDAPPDAETPDVHGNQVALLERSACFRSSQMTCATCHDVHREQRDLAELSAKCLTCHTPQSCGLFPRHGQALLGRCVDCHMPALTSDAVVATQRGKRLQVQVRTHWIKVYPEFSSLHPTTYRALPATRAPSPAHAARRAFRPSRTDP
jgi:Cytochrome c554 and c-prime